MIKDYETGVLRAFEFENIYHRIPELSHLDCVIDSVSFEKAIDSSDMNPRHWVNIAETIENNYDVYDGFVVLHGSDTMSYSASALSFMLDNLAKPVIFTGSQLPIGDLRTDAKENLITSIQLAALKENGKSVIQEVGLYFEYKLYRGNRTTKINAENFQAFVSMNYPTLAESGVHLFAVLLVPSIGTYARQSDEIAALRTSIDAKQAEQEALKEQIARWDDPLYIKQQARDRINLVMPGERNYMVVGTAPEDVDPEEANQSPAEVRTDLPWVDALFDSVQRAATD